ncbi:MAG: hypothetical protein BWX44_01776 [Spirochaetes bacterium ADurb.Bin001]|nr:MAG: hypothetical protein BWX44_01776 [Spirochaetes bacterium ADurb.Bin001]
MIDIRSHFAYVSPNSNLVLIFSLLFLAIYRDSPKSGNKDTSTYPTLVKESVYIEELRVGKGSHNPICAKERFGSFQHKEVIMTRINLLVAKVVLLGICIWCVSSGSVWAEEIKISVTAYTLKECFHNKGVTASGEPVRKGIVAVSRDLERKGLTLGTKIQIGNMGTFVIKDRMNRRKKGNIDIYMTSYTDALKFGKQKYTLVRKQRASALPENQKQYVWALN